MKQARRLAVLICVLISGVLSCEATENDSFTERPENAVQLMGSFASYQSRESVQGNLRTQRLTWDVVEDTKAESADHSRPPFQIVVFKVEPFSDRGSTGVLRLELFNDRLMSAWFYPIDITSYREALEKQFPQIRGKTSITISAQLHLRQGIDHENREYFAWEDTRLREQLKRWIHRYS